MKAWRYSADTGAKASHLPGYTTLVHAEADGTGWLCSELTHRTLGDQVPREGRAVEIDEKRWAEARERLIFAYTSMISTPLPEATRDEVHLLLYCKRDLKLEYMGRGSHAEKRNPAAKEDLIAVDIAGRGRAYLFRVVHGRIEDDERLQRLAKIFGEWNEWLGDPKAKIVLSFGGGGMRLFGATTVLKVVDRLLPDRSSVAEVWGSSGGAVLAYTYAHGFDAETLENLGYDLYHARNPELTRGSVLSLARAQVRRLIRDLKGEKSKPETAAWLDAMDRHQPRDQRRTTRVPMYALATNEHREGITALADPSDIPPFCQDFILPCDPRDAVGASTAVPGVLAPPRGITGLKDSERDEDLWVDGSILDENPITLPYIKWMREREQSPSTTRERLKILLVSLNLRSSELPALQMMQKVPLLRRVKSIRRIARLIDLALDSKTEAVIRAVTESPHVEIYKVSLSLGALHLVDPLEIPSAIRAGSTIDSWRFTTYRKLS